MSDDAAEPVVDLAFVGRALRRLTDDVAGLRDEMRVQTAMILRIEGNLNGVVDQMRAMVAQHARLVDRVRQLEDERR